MKVRMENRTNGAIKEVKAGFSWTVFFFGALVPLFRGDAKWFFIMFAVNISVLIVLGPLGILPGIAWGFMYNRIYLKELLDRGFFPMGESDHRILNNYIY